MTVNITPTEQDYFDDYVRAGIPPEAARRFAREEARTEPTDPSPDHTNGRSE